MSKLQNNTHVTGGGISVFSIAILLMVSGWVMETADYEVELAQILFTIGWWLFIIPLIILAIVIGIMIIAVVLAT